MSDEHGQDDKRSLRLDRGMVPLGLALTLVASTAVATFSGISWLNSKLAPLQSIDRRLERLEERAQREQTNRWGYSDQLLWSEQLGRDNPALKVPRPTRLGPG